VNTFAGQPTDELRLERFDKNTGDASDIPNEKRHHANAGCRRNGRTGYRDAVGIGRVTRTLPLGLGPRNTIEARTIKIFIGR